jgi:4-hydroxymandelate oxidase
VSVAAGKPPFLTPDQLAALQSVEEFEPLAADRMGPAWYDAVRGWAGTGWTTRANRAAFERWVFRPRVLVDVRDTTLETTVLGRRIALPILFGPSASHRLSHPDGELATARAAKALDTIQVLSLHTTVSLEEVAQVGHARWLQLYWYTDHGVTAEIVVRAEAAGYEAIALTVDAARTPWWELWKGRPFELPDGFVEANHPGHEYVHESSIGWRDLGWLRARSRLPLVLKGIVSVADARLAAAHGIEAIIVSNHGGRMLDGALPSIDALPPIADAVGHQLEVYMDGGVRRGTDVLKALALGARAVLIGRPVQWGLATGGEAGVLRMVELIARELHSAMALCGARSPAGVSRAMIASNPDPTAGRPASTDDEVLGGG